MAGSSWAPNTLLDALTPADRTALLELGPTRAYAPGRTLIWEAGPETDVFLIIAGFVRVEATTADGRSVLLSLRVAGEMVGELAPLAGMSRSATVVAATAVTAAVVSWHRLQGFLAKHPAAADAMHAAVASKFHHATRHRIAVAGSSLTKRVASVLMYLAEAHGLPDSGSVRIAVPLSQPDLARLVGVSEPSLRRALAELRDSGIVTSGYRTQAITDMAALRRKADAS